MKLYEGYFVLPPEATVDVRKNQLKALEDLIKKFNGKVIQKTELGKRPMGYLVKKFRDGYVVVFDYELDPSQADGLRKTLQLHEDLIKFMVTVKKVVKAETPETAKAEKPVKTAATIKKASYQEQNT